MCCINRHGACVNRHGTRLVVDLVVHRYGDFRRWFGVLGRLAPLGNLGVADVHDELIQYGTKGVLYVKLSLHAEKGKYHTI